jgi:hypothetical protein
VDLAEKDGTLREVCTVAKCEISPPSVVEVTVEQGSSRGIEAPVANTEVKTPVVTFAPIQQKAHRETPVSLQKDEVLRTVVKDRTEALKPSEQEVDRQSKIKKPVHEQICTAQHE